MLARGDVSIKSKKKRQVPARDQPLTPEVIVDAALRIGDAYGVEGISTRRLGEELGASHTAVYLHFPSREKLLMAVFDRALSLASRPIPREGPWEDRARAVCSIMRNALLAHPVCYSLMPLFPGRGSAMWQEDLARIIADAGYSGKEKTFVQHLLSEVTMGLTTIHAVGKAGLTFERASREDRAILGEFLKLDFDRVFAVAIEFIIAGIKRGLPETNPSRRRASRRKK